MWWGGGLDGTAYCVSLIWYCACDDVRGLGENVGVLKQLVLYMNVGVCMFVCVCVLIGVKCPGMEDLWVDWNWGAG